VASPDSSDSVRQDITERLDAVEREHDATVLYACESGSRAWGFASADSDYDVRFIYTHPRDWYLSLDLDRRDDTVDPPVTEALDLHGWDLRKALRLFRTSNPSLLEWLRSPIVYREDEATMTRWRDLLPRYYTPRAAGYAYRNMAQSIAQGHLSGETVSRKAYLYVLRALLAVRWVEQQAGPVPVRFNTLVGSCVESQALQTAIEQLVAEKRAGREEDALPPRPPIHAFIDEELDRLQDSHFADASPQNPWEPLNAVFRDVLSRFAPLP